MVKHLRQLLSELVPPDEKPIVFLDMDGVIVDLDAGVKKLVGFTMDGWKARAESMKDRNGTTPTEVSNNTLWKLIGDEGDKFWATLPWTTDGKALWAHLNKRHEVHILSAASRDNSGKVRTGKRAWLGRNIRIPDSRVHIVARVDKKNYATHNNRTGILIDDQARNIKAFVGAGGKGILHTSTVKTLRQLKKIGL